MLVTIFVRVFLILALVLVAGAAHAREVTRQYDSHGRRSGTIVRQGERETRYDAQGRRAETSVTRGNERRTYGAHGRRTGTEKVQK